MVALIDTLNHQFRYNNETLTLNSQVVSCEYVISMNEVSRATIILSQNINLNRGDNCRMEMWFGSAPATILDTGRMYVDSFRLTEGGEYQIELIALNFNLVPITPTSRTAPTITSINQEVRNAYILADGAGSIVNAVTLGISPTSNSNNVIEGSSLYDILVQGGQGWAFNSFIIGGILFTYSIEQHWFGFQAQIPENITLDLDYSDSTIDATRVIRGVRYRDPNPTTYTDWIVPYVPYGKIRDLTDEGFNFNAASGQRRINGASFENNKNTRYYIVKSPALIGPDYYPGKLVNAQAASAGQWSLGLIRSHTYSYSDNGFISTITAQWPSF